jgi:uncharacterized protein YgfB (UPF0149 family)
MHDDNSGWIEWDQAFNSIPELSSPAELHGLLTGIICVAKAPTGDQWQQILARLGFEPLDDVSLRLLTEEAEDMALSLSEDHLDYMPLLPDDEHALEERVTALADWCSGVLLGFGLASGTVRADENELLRDLHEMASITFEAEDDDEEGEEGYADLVEFARLIPVSLSTGREKISLAGSALLSLKVEPSVVLPDQADDAVDQTLDQQHDVVDMLTKDRPS